MLPPSIGMMAPVIQDDASDAKKTASPWMSSGWPMRLMLGEQADLLLEGQRVIPARLLSEGFVFDYPDLRSALINLD